MHFARSSRFLTWFCLIWLALAPRATAADVQVEPRPRSTVLGTRFNVHPQFDAAIDERVVAVRKLIEQERSCGKFVAYVSVPLTARGGGHQETNLAIALLTKQRLEGLYGRTRFWALVPGQAESTIPPIDGLKPGGGEYMYMWTQVLAGEDGLAGDFDLVYFVGPRDVAAYFQFDARGVLESLEAHVDRRAAGDDGFRREIAEVPARRRDFVRYYGLRASCSFSSGALDEWNIFRLANARRGVGDQVPVYFDGRAASPAEFHAAARTGYELAPPPAVLSTTGEATTGG